MASKKSSYYDAILSALEGKAQGPGSRVDWEGPSVVLELYGNTSGSNRTDFVRSLGQILQDQPCSAAALAQLVDIVSSLDLAELEPEVTALKRSANANQEPLRNAIANYLAYRQLHPGLAVKLTDAGKHAHPAG